MIWTPLDSWIVAAAALAGVSCAVVGAFLVLQKMSMMGDAISHAVLPGIAIAFIVTASRASGVMFIGAAAVGVVTAVLVQAVRQHGRLEHGAAMGVVFTVLFAVGLILIEQAAHHVDIHPEHVLFGAVELVPLHLIRIGAVQVPRGVAVLATILLVDLTVVAVLFKELRLATFDPELATTLGIDARRIHYLLMTLVALTAVAAFEVVGSILVIAMLIVPGATAHLLTRRLLPFLLASVAIALAAALLGHVAAIGIPPLFGFEDTSTSGTMAVVLGVIFFGAFLFAPEHGVVAKAWVQARLRATIVMQDALGLLARAAEQPENAEGCLSVAEFRSISRSPFSGGAFGLRGALALLRLQGLVTRSSGRYRLSARGTSAAREILRSHRLWERFFYDDGGVDLAELHPAADYLEHFTSRELREELAGRFKEQNLDPRGRRIPQQDG